MIYHDNSTLLSSNLGVGCWMWPKTYDKIRLKTKAIFYILINKIRNICFVQGIMCLGFFFCFLLGQNYVYLIDIMLKLIPWFTPLFCTAYSKADFNCELNVACLFVLHQIALNLIKNRDDTKKIYAFLFCQFI